MLIDCILKGKIDVYKRSNFGEEKCSSYFCSMLEKLKNLILDFAELEYVSSAGLRVILSAQKTMNKQGQIVNIPNNVETFPVKTASKACLPNLL